MPLWGPPALGSGGEGGSNVTVNEAGFVVVANGPPPFKDVYEEDGDVLRLMHVVQHPVYGELTSEITDFDIS
jgi:hypothetical protein